MDSKKKGWISIQLFFCFCNNAYINICRQLRFQFFDQSNVDFALFLGLPGMIQNGQHIFNVWHAQMGGTKPEILQQDRVIRTLSKIALELFPLFLIKVPQENPSFGQMYMHLTPTIYGLPEYNQLLKDMVQDKSLIKMFTAVGKSAMETSGYYNSSNGRGGTIQLSMLPTLIITNAYLLMRLRNNLSEENFIAVVIEMIEIFRSIADGQAVELPVLFGFHNVSLDNSSILETTLGIIRAYDDELLEIIPRESRPSMLSGENKLLGVLLETKYEYAADFRADPEAFKPHAKFEQVTKDLENTREDLSLAFALSINRSAPVGVVFAWTTLFDPLSPGLNISWNNRPSKPMEYYLCKPEDRQSIKTWCDILKRTDDSKIRIAIRRILSALNERINPVDGFIDSIIAWENLFGGDTELSFRISASIACLLEENETRRFDLQNQISKLYNARSKIVHGNKEIGNQESVQMRNECLSIAIRCLRNLYQVRTALLAKDSTERSKKLILE